MVEQGPENAVDMAIKDTDPEVRELGLEILEDELVEDPDDDTLIERLANIALTGPENEPQPRRLPSASFRPWITDRACEHLTDKVIIHVKPHVTQPPDDAGCTEVNVANRLCKKHNLIQRIRLVRNPG